MDDEESNTLTESLLSKNDKAAADGTATAEEGISFVVDEEAEVLVPTDTEFGSSPPIATASATATAADASSVTPIPVPTGDWERGERQTSKYRDLPYAIAFHLQFQAVLILAMIHAKKVYKVLITDFTVDDDVYYDEKYDIKSSDDEEVTRLFRLFRNSMLVNLISSLLLIMISFAIMTKLGSAFITCSVWTQVIFSAAMAVAFFANGTPIAGALFAFSALMGACYAWTVRRRIPFAAANLKLGTKVIQGNLGVFLLSLASGIIMFGWWGTWVVSLLGVTGAKKVCHEEGNEMCSIELSQSGWIFPWVLLLFWTQQVVKNVIHTTTAGIAATWYFSPVEARGCCSAAVCDSTKRSLTTSFGSICLGSLLVAIIQFLDYLVQNLRRNNQENGQSQTGAGAILLCCLDCILQMLEGIMEYFNKWAFIYVGLYGYPYVEAGKRVTTLFTQRGWTVIINDHLVSNALGLMSFTVGLISATVTSLLISDNVGLFVINFIIALSLALTMTTLIDSAVSSIIVCFAEAPGDLQRNHPNHHRELVEAWNKVYPMVRC